jgi:hypothetical protein
VQSTCWPTSPVRHQQLTTEAINGRGVVKIPPSIIPELRDHLGTYVGSQDSDLVFTGPLGGILRRATSAETRAGLPPSAS